MRWLKLALALVVLVPAWAVLGAYVALDSGSSPYVGLAVGGLVEATFGLMMGGDPRWRVWDSVFGPPEHSGEER
jgi:hypothetical protein